MNKENVRKWVKALRSGKYKQARNSLAGPTTNVMGEETGYGYCCLGVVCEIAKVKYQPKRGYLPRAAQKWLGISQNNPLIYKKTNKAYGITEKVHAVEMNDDMHFSFKKIAKLIEKHLLKGK